MSKFVVTATINGKTKEKAVKIAKEEKRSLSSLIEIALEELIERKSPVEIKQVQRSYSVNFSDKKKGV